MLVFKSFVPAHVLAQFSLTVGFVLHCSRLRLHHREPNLSVFVEGDVCGALVGCGALVRGSLVRCGALVRGSLVRCGALVRGSLVEWGA